MLSFSFWAFVGACASLLVFFAGLFRASGPDMTLVVLLVHGAPPVFLFVNWRLLPVTCTIELDFY